MRFFKRFPSADILVGAVGLKIGILRLFDPDILVGSTVVGEVDSKDEY